MLLLVKRPDPVTMAPEIHYRDIGDHLSREQKLEIVAGSQLSEMQWERIKPNEAGDWTQQRSERFLGLRPLAEVSSQPLADAPIFRMSTLGLLSARDAWVFQSSGAALREQIEQTTDFFNEQVQGFARLEGLSSARLAAARAYATRDDTRFRWAVTAEERLARGQEIRIAEHGFRPASYRPFFRQRLYMDRALNHRVHQLPSAFPAGVERASGIVVANKVVDDSAGVLAVDTVPAYHFAGSEGRFFRSYPLTARTPSGILRSWNGTRSATSTRSSRTTTRASSTSPRWFTRRSR